MKFLELPTISKAVIYVLSSIIPLQKSQIVQLVMEYDKVITLANGDDANDVSMIQHEHSLEAAKQSKIFQLFDLKAHTDVGLSGQETWQVVLTSDQQDWTTSTSWMIITQSCSMILHMYINVFTLFFSTKMLPFLVDFGLLCSVGFQFK